MPTGNPRMTLPLLRLPCRRLCTSHAAWCGRVPDLTSVKNAEDVGPYHSGRFSYPRSNRNIRSFWLNSPHAASDSATATACNVSSVIAAFFPEMPPSGKHFGHPRLTLGRSFKGRTQRIPNCEPNKRSGCPQVSRYKYHQKGICAS